MIDMREIFMDAGVGAVVERAFDGPAERGNRLSLGATARLRGPDTFEPHLAPRAREALRLDWQAAVARARFTLAHAATSASSGFVSWRTKPV